MSLTKDWHPAPNIPLVLGYKRPPEHQDFIVVAGPCSVEDGMDLASIAQELSFCGANYARGGVFRAGTYPPDRYGLRRDLLRSWARSCFAQDLGVIVEVLDTRQVEFLANYCTAFQVGARHMQDYALLRELSSWDRTVFLKRGTGSKVKEWLGACEYLLQGKAKPILVERGISTFNDHCRWTADPSAIAVLKAEGIDVPVIVDASHGTGRSDLVRPLTLAGVAAGADGFLVEVHPNPKKSLSDANQAYPLDDLGELVRAALDVREASRG